MLSSTSYETHKIINIDIYVQQPYNTHILYLKGVLKLNAVNVTIRMDENVKKQSEQVLHELGLNMTTAINVYMRAIARQRKIPFELSLSELDPFFSETNQARLALSKKQIADGRIIYKTEEDLNFDDE